MDIEYAIKELKSAKAPSRNLDALVAQATGWRSERHPYKDPETGEDTYRTLWLVPSGKDFDKVPHYSASIDAAKKLADDIAPGAETGCAWEVGLGSARIGDGPYVQAAHPAIALCIAALNERRKRSAMIRGNR